LQQLNDCSAAPSQAISYGWQIQDIRFQVGRPAPFPKQLNGYKNRVGQPKLLKLFGRLNPFGRAISFL
jgi:hypothetical protein